MKNLHTLLQFFTLFCAHEFDPS